jgi:hypothetical protein
MPETAQNEGGWLAIGSLMDEATRTRTDRLMAENQRLIADMKGCQERGNAVAIARVFEELHRHLEKVTAFWDELNVKDSDEPSRKKRREFFKLTHYRGLVDVVHGCDRIPIGSSSHALCRL